MFHYGHLVFHDTVLFPGIGNFSHTQQGMDDKQGKHNEYSKKDGNGVPLSGAGQKCQSHGLGHPVKGPRTQDDTGVQNDVRPHEQPQNKTGTTLEKIQPGRNPALFFI